RGDFVRGERAPELRERSEERAIERDAGAHRDAFSVERRFDGETAARAERDVTRERVAEDAVRRGERESLVSELRRDRVRDAAGGSAQREARDGGRVVVRALGWRSGGQRDDVDRRE